MTSSGYRQDMFREGPFPAFLHGLAEYVVGGLFIALPLVLDYESGAATAASIIIGIVMVGVAASTDWNLSLNNSIPKAVHFAIDWILAAILIAAPFLFGFSDDSTPAAIFIGAGVLHLLLTIGTRFGKKTETAARAKSKSSKVRAAADDTDRERRLPAGEGHAAPARAEEATPDAAPAEPAPQSDRSSARRS